MASVLIVDDELAIVETLAEILTWAGYQVLSAANGQEGLAALEQRPSVVLLDFMMPVMDGLQMLRAMRSDARHRRTPVILMSAAGLDTVRAADWLKHRKTMPWNAFLAKPFDPSALLAAVKGVLDHRR